jgi:hypothetical protein
VWLAFHVSFSLIPIFPSSSRTLSPPNITT